MTGIYEGAAVLPQLGFAAWDSLSLVMTQGRPPNCLSLGVGRLQQV